MKENMPSYCKIDMENWPRREHFAYYRDQLKCGYTLTKRVDVTKLRQYCSKHNKKFYGSFIYAVSKVVNEMDSMRMMIAPDGEPGVWEVSHPNFTVFHKDDETFSDLWMEYKPDYEDFYEEFLSVTEQYGHVKGVKGRSGQPANFFCVSCVPWIDFTGCAMHSVGEPAMFPIITFGKYSKEGEQYTLSVSLTISHLSADGYHASCFFKRLQCVLQEFS